MTRIGIFLCATFVFLSQPAYAHELCNGAVGMYAEDLILKLQRDNASAPEAAIREQIRSGLNHWLAANQRIAKETGFMQRIFVCGLPDLNAFVTGRNEPVRVYLETVRLLGTKEDEIAAMLAHEYSHLILNHRAQRIAVGNALDRWKARAFDKILRRNLDVQDAATSERLVETVWSEFSVQQELEADDESIKILSKSGYEPNAFRNLALIGLKYRGGDSFEPFPSHPGFVQRMLAGEDRVVDETFAQMAGELKANGDFRVISTLVKKWLSRLPDSGNARYYKAVLLRHFNRPMALEAMEDAMLPTRKPSLNQHKGDLDSAWLWLCTQLFHEGYATESAWCGETQLKHNEKLWAEFKNRTFKERMWIADHGNADRALRMSFVRKHDGTKLITNDASTAAWYGVSETPYVPVWRPIRFKACEDTKEKPCPRHPLSDQ